MTEEVGRCDEVGYRSGAVWVADIGFDQRGSSDAHRVACCAYRPVFDFMLGWPSSRR